MSSIFPFLSNTPPGHLSQRLRVSTSVFVSEPNPTPLRDIPGDYGLPLLGAIRDRWDFLYFQGQDNFFKSRIERLKSTVIRLNMPPGPPIARNPKVIALLDAVSFPTLFDVSKVEKKNLFTGTYMPSVNLTGGYRTLSFLDPSEPRHAQLKELLFKLISSRRHVIIPEFRSTFGEMYDDIESKLGSHMGMSKSVDFSSFSDQASFDFLGKAFFGLDPKKTKLGSDAPNLITIWVAFQLGPIVTLGLPFFIEEPLLRVFSFPPFLVRHKYKRLYDYFSEAGKDIMEEAERMGVPKDEACHNLLYTICFNSFGGMKIFFPTILKWLGKKNPELNRLLAEEIRSAVEKAGGKVTMEAIEKDMPLTKSVVYEAFRLEPPVPFQYAHAKKDFVIQNHDNTFKVKKGEMLFGYQPMATRDGRVFNRPEEFVPDRFLGEEGEKLLKYVFWSNGRETESTTLDNKQCAGKEFVVLMARLLVVETYLRYDSVEATSSTSPLGNAVKITSLKKRGK